MSRLGDDRPGQREQRVSVVHYIVCAHRYPHPAFLPKDIEARYTVRELAYGIATEIHAVNNLPVLKYLKDPLGHTQDEIDLWYRHWLKRTLDPVEARLAQLQMGDFLHGDAPGLFEHLLADAMAKMAIDQPAYASHQAELTQTGARAPAP